MTTESLLFECSQDCHQCGRCFIDKRSILTDSTPLRDFGMLPAKMGYGIAVDIGTTTIVAYLWDFMKKQVNQVSAKTNGQRKYGLDVIRRQQQAISGSLNQLHEIVIKDVNRLILELTSKPDDISVISVVGNTTMRDLFFNMPPEWSTTPPYVPDSKDSIITNAHDMGLITRDAVIYSPPVIHGYWGSDALVGVYALDLCKDPYVLFLDLGTNGEIALSYPSPRGNTILATSVSSAPCFEGMQIQCGMGAKQGAISHITLDESLTPTYEIISDDPGLNQSPRGLCGSGVIDIVAELLTHRVITPSGLFNPQYDHQRIAQTDNGKRFQIHTAPDLYLTLKDIGEVLMAKASFAAAIQTLIDEIRSFHPVIEKTYLAGAFGFHCKPENALRIGLIPHSGLIESVGNTAGLGAIHYLYEEERNKINQSVDTIKYFNLTGNERFNEHYLSEHMFSTASLGVNYPTLS